jgi:hypothetical protein
MTSRHYHDQSNPSTSGRSRGDLRGLALLLAGLVGLSLTALGCFPALGASSERTVEWKEEVALHDGGIAVAAWRVELVAGDPFKGPVAGARRLAFRHPTTGRPIIWENPGEVGSRLSPNLLDFDGARPYLVTMASTAPDYSGLGCPTPPYIVFRHEGGTWVRVPLAELPTRFWKPNLLGFAGEEFIKRSKGYVSAAQVEARFAALRKRGDTEYYGRIDRRIRNPLGLGCNRDAIERVYGPEKYDDWLRLGNWLDKSEEEALNLLRGKSRGVTP